MNRFDILDIKLNNRNAKFLIDLYENIEDAPKEMVELYNEKLYDTDVDLTDEQHRCLNYIMASDYVSYINVDNDDSYCDSLIKIINTLIDLDENSKLVVNYDLMPTELYKIISKLPNVGKNDPHLKNKITMIEYDIPITYSDGDIISLSTQGCGMVCDRKIVLMLSVSNCAEKTLGTFNLKGL